MNDGILKDMSDPGHKDKASIASSHSDAETSKTKKKDGLKLKGWLKSLKRSSVASTSSSTSSARHRPTPSSSGSADARGQGFGLHAANTFDSAQTITSSSGSTEKFKKAPISAHRTFDSESSSVTNVPHDVQDGDDVKVEGRGAKARLSQAVRVLETLVKVAAPCIDGDPIKAAAAAVKAFVDIKQAVGENKDLLKELQCYNAEKLAMVDAQEGHFPGSAGSKRIARFYRVLQKQKEEIDRLSSRGAVERILDYEQQKKDIESCFKKVDGAMKALQLEITWSIERMVDGIHSDVKAIRLDRFRCAPEATYDAAPESGVTWTRAFCTEGTRQDIQAEIKRWAEDRSAPRVFWLTGQAGAGKTTIASTLARTFDELDTSNEGDKPLPPAVLGGNFLCSRLSAKASQRTNILPTLVYQLARKSRSFAEALNREDRFDLVNKPNKQMVGLLVDPWKEVLRRNLSHQIERGEYDYDEELPQYLIVIDALDEVEGEEGPRFLTDLLAHVDTLQGLKFLVTSRTHPEVEAQLGGGKFETVCRLQDVPKADVESDILRFLESRLPKFVQHEKRHEMLKEVARRADGLFIYAATVVRYLTGDDLATVVEQVDLLTSLLNPSGPGLDIMDLQAWTAPIDQLYHQIVGDIFFDCKPRFREKRLRILHTFLSTMERTSPAIVASLVSPDVSDDSDVSANEELTRGMLDKLHAVLYLNTEDRVLWYHQSFPDFMFTLRRATFEYRNQSFEVWCDKLRHDAFLAGSALAIMRAKLKFNIAGIVSSYMLDAEDQNLPVRVSANVPGDLWYACRYWVDHLLGCGDWKEVGENKDGEGHIKLANAVEDFLSLRVLFWIETMNLLGLKGQCGQMLRAALRWTPVSSFVNAELRESLHEAANFCIHFGGSPASLSTPHLYLSALSTWLPDGKLSRRWRQHFPYLPSFKHYTTGNPALMTITTPTTINSSAFSPDGRYIASGWNDQSVRVWDVSTGELLKVLNGHEKLVCAVAFSPDGRRLASGSDDKTIRLWDVWTGTEMEVFEGHGDTIVSVGFSPDGRRIVSGSQDRSVRVWETRMAKETMSLTGQTHWATFVAFSRDGKHVLSVAPDGFVRQWDASTGAATNELNGYSEDFGTCIAVSLDGTCVASGTLNGFVQISSVKTRTQINVLKGHTDIVLVIAFSSDGRFIVSGSLDRSVRVWNVLSGAEVNILTGHTDMITFVAFSPSGNHIVSSSYDGSVRVWNTFPRSGFSTTLQGHSSAVTCVAYSRDSRFIASGSTDKSVNIWDTRSGKQVYSFHGHTEEVCSVHFSPDGRQLVSGAHDRSVRLWEVAAGDVSKVLNQETGAVQTVAYFSPDGNFIFSASADGVLRKWETSTGTEVQVFRHDGVPVAFSPNADRIVSKTDRSWSDKTTRLLHGPGYTLSKTLIKNTKVYVATFSADGMYIASGLEDNSVRVWDVLTGAEIHLLSGHTDVAVSVAFSSDGQRLASGSKDHSVRIWDPSDGGLLKTFNSLSGEIRSVAFSPDGRHLVIGAHDSTVRVWEVDGLEDTGALAWDLEYSEADPTSRNWLVSRPGGERLMSVSRDITHVLKLPSIVSIMAREGYATIDFVNARLGNKWTQCYVPR